MSTSLSIIWNTPYEEVLNFLNQYGIKNKTLIGILSSEEQNLVNDINFQKIMLSKKDFDFHQILISGIAEVVRN